MNDIEKKKTVVNIISDMIIRYLILRKLFLICYKDHKAYKIVVGLSSECNL